MHYDNVELVEDDSVKIGDCSPAPNLFPATTTEEEAIGCLFSVQPIRLSRATPVYGTYFSPHHLKHLPASNRTEAVVMRAWADMQAHGMNSASIYAKLERRQPDKTWAIDLERPGEPDSLPAQMRQLQEAGLLEDARPQMLLPHEAGSSGKIFNEERVVRAVEAMRREQGWPELLWYLVDEPGSEKRIALAKTLTAIVHRVPGVRTTTATIRQELYDNYDVFIPGVPGQMSALEEIVRRAEADGKEVWSYNCTWNGNHPINDRFYAGLYMWTSGLRGNWQWCFAGRGYQEGAGEGGLPRLTDELDLGAIAHILALR